jgi:UDP-N-acetyl-D-galactosamine dehydrogenase
VADIIKELQSYSLQVHVSDPHADSDELKHEYGFELTPDLTNDYEAVIVSVPHKAYLEMDDNYFTGITKPNAIIADIKGVFGGKISSRAYWSL